MLLLVIVLSLVATSSKLFLSVPVKRQVTVDAAHVLGLVPERVASRVWQLLTSGLVCHTFSGSLITIPTFALSCARVEAMVQSQIAQLVPIAAITCSSSTLVVHYAVYTITRSTNWITAVLGGLHGPTLFMISVLARSVHEQPAIHIEPLLTSSAQLSLPRVLVIALAVALSSAAVSHSADLVTHPITGALAGWFYAPVHQTIRKRAAISKTPEESTALHGSSDDPQKRQLEARGERLVQQQMQAQLQQDEQPEPRLAVANAKPDSSDGNDNTATGTVSAVEPAEAKGNEEKRDEGGESNV